MNRPAAAAALLASIVLGCTAPDAHPAPHAVVHDSRIAMGTLLELTLVTGDASLADECYARVEALERVVSRWRPASETSRLNAGAGSWQPVSPALLELLRTAKRLHRATDGAFDVTVGPAIALWKDAAARGRPPTAIELAAAHDAIGAQRIGIGAGRARLAHAMSIDLGGLAKGWALDRLEPWLRARGVEHALLDFGGSSLLAIGAPPDGPAWRVLVQAGEGAGGVLSFADRHVSVSASLGQSTMIGSARHGHVIDPRTARTVDREAVAIAVGPRGADAEAFSTALLVEGRALVAAAEAAGLAVRLHDGDAVSVSDGFPPFAPLADR